MSEGESSVERFEEHRDHLRAVAYRMLGSMNNAEDAVQETWLRLNRAETSAVQNLRAWLTTVLSRVCLDMLRSRKSHREDPLDDELLEMPESALGGDDFTQERDLILADTVGLALLTVLDALTPAERVTFVLHDIFDISFDEIGRIVGRTPLAARKLASRARLRLRDQRRESKDDLVRKRAVVDAFLAASRGGDFSALLALLDPEVVLRGDAAAVRMGAQAEVRGSAAVAETFKGRAQGAEAAILGGAVGAAWFAGGSARVAFAFTIVDGRITAMELIADPERLRSLDITLFS